MNDRNRNTGIHTFELRCNLSLEQFSAIKDSLYNLCENYSKPFYPVNDYYHSYKCDVFSDYGLGILLCTNLLKLTVNPSRLTDHNDIIGLFDAKDDFSHITEIFQILTSYLDDFLPPELFQCLVISRIDYTVDAFLPSDEHVLLMIKLAKKHGLPRGFQDTYPAKIRNLKNFNNSYSYNISRKDGAYRVTLYAKHKQLADSRKNIPDDLLDNTVGLLRAEISCSCSTNLLDTDAVSYQLSHDALLNVYHDIFPKVFPYGTYLISPKAKSLIEEQYRNKRTIKKHLLKFLDIIIEHHTVHQAYQIFDNKNILKKDLLERFYNIGLNPVTIAVNDKIKYMPSIYFILGLENPYLPHERKLLSYLQ